MDEERINFYSENEFRLPEQRDFTEWILRVIRSEGKKAGEINYIFCNDDYLLPLNQEYLKHDTLTDIITFDNSLGDILNGDIYISTERVRENATIFGVLFDDELKRVMVHGVLHLAGYMDSGEEDKRLMRSKEDEKIKMFHVEQ